MIILVIVAIGCTDYPTKPFEDAEVFEYYMYPIYDFTNEHWYAKAAEICLYANARFNDKTLEFEFKKHTSVYKRHMCTKFLGHTALIELGGEIPEEVPQGLLQ